MKNEPMNKHEIADALRDIVLGDKISDAPSNIESYMLGTVYASKWSNCAVWSLVNRHPVESKEWLLSL